MAARRLTSVGNEHDFVAQGAKIKFITTAWLVRTFQLLSVPMKERHRVIKGDAEVGSDDGTGTVGGGSPSMSLTIVG